MKTFLKIVGATVLLGVLAFAALVGYAAYANHAAERDAGAFCGNVQPGTDVDAVIARARAQGRRYRGSRVEDGKEIHDLVFPGWVLNAVVCRVVAVNGKVISRETIKEDD